MVRFKNIKILLTVSFCSLLISCSKDTPTQSTPASPALNVPAYGATNVAASPTFSWSSVNEAEGYKLQASRNDQFNDGYLLVQVASASYTPASPLTAFTTYFWRVCSYNGAGSSGWSPASFFATGGLQPAAIPPAPILAAPINGSTYVPVNPLLIWNPSDSLSLYSLQISTDSTFANVSFQFNGISGIHQAVSGYLTDNKKYFWRAMASNSYGTSPWSSVYAFTTAPQVVP
ncbi:MAG: hypothetical protein Q7W05_12450 [Deltaproteobacteria bacterium]|nr:hypothetical protein [Deltaproteobacteria bacterium]